MPSSSPRLWIVATPLGNPGDLSPRARETLEAVDLVLAEDTRLASALFRRCGVTARRLESFYEHNEAEKLEEALRLLRAGGQAALISDAGTPLLADPGYRLVEKCRAENIPVSPVPGPSAPACALSAAGLPPIPYSFLGFLPRSPGDRKKLFCSFAATPGSLVFFERKDRLAQSLKLAHDALGERKIAICREMTKKFEEFILGDLRDHQSLAANLLGELTVVIGPAGAAIRSPEDEAKKLMLSFLAQGEKKRAAAKKAAAELRGWSSGELYELAEKN